MALNPINPFLTSGAPQTGGTTTPLTAPTSTTIKPNTNSGFLSQQPGALGAAASSINGSMQTRPVPTGFTVPSAWSSPAVTTHPAAAGTNINPAAANETTNQQFLSKYGLTSMPAGYFFNANGTLVNGAGQEYTTPPAPSAPTKTSGAGTGGGQPFQGDYTFDANGNVTGTTSSPTTQGSSPDPATAPSTAGSTAANTTSAIQNLESDATQGSTGDAAESALQGQIQALQTNYGSQLGNITGSEMPEAFETGAANVLSSQYAPQLTALTNQLASLQANRTASISAGTAAAGAGNTLQGLQQENQAISPGQSLYNLYSGQSTGSVAPLGQVLNPAQSLVSPFTGNTLTSGSGAAGVQSLAQEVASGQMSYQQAQSSLADSAQSPQLQQAISAINPNFNFQQSATNANVQGQIAPAAANATAQIQNLGQALNNIPALENTSVPLLNTLTRLGSSLTGVGGGGATALESARQDAIGAVTGALEAANGMTPTAAGSLADSYFPPGLTQAQYQSGMQQFQAQIAGKEAAFSNPGAVPQNAGTQSNTVTAGGYTYTQNAQGQWVAS